MIKILSLFVLICSTAAASCSTSHDCSLNGECVNSKCVCDKPWKNEQCDELIVNDAYDAYRNASQASWGGNVVHVNGTYHLFVAQMALSCGLDHWGTNSMIIRATSENASGPYAFQDIVVQPFAHNPTIRELPNDKGFVIFFIGGSVSKPVDCRQNHTASPGSLSSSTLGGAIHAVFSPSVEGPWSDPVQITFTQNKSAADSEWGPAVTNPSPFIHPDGTVTLALQRAYNKNKGKELIGVARSDTDWRGPYTMITSTPVEPEHWYCVAGTGEDPFLWSSSRGLHIIYHGMCPTGFLEAHYAFSEDNGTSWTVSKHQTYSYEFHNIDGSSHFFARVERPQLLFDSNTGNPSYLINGVCEGDSLSEINTCLFKQAGMTWTAFRSLG